MTRQRNLLTDEQLSSVSRILLVSLDQLGDLVFASALVEPLRERFPRARIDLWCRTQFAEVGTLIPGVDQVYSVNPFWITTRGSRRGTVAELLRGVGEIRRAAHDLAMLAAAPWRTAAAVRLTRIPIRIGHERRRNHRFLTHAVAGDAVDRPVVIEAARLLEPLGISRSDLTTRLDATPIADRIAGIRRLGGDRPIAVLHAFADDRSRCVALDRWRSAARVLADRFTILWVGRGEELAEVRARDTDERWLYLDRCTEGTLLDTAAATAAATVFVGHDSGPLHVANALGTPAVGIYAPGEPRRTFPQGRGQWRMIAASRPEDVTAEQIVQATIEMGTAGTG